MISEDAKPTDLFDSQAAGLVYAAGAILTLSRGGKMNRCVYGQDCELLNTVGIGTGFPIIRNVMALESERSVIVGAGRALVRRRQTSRGSAEPFGLPFLGPTRSLPPHCAVPMQYDSQG